MKRGGPLARHTPLKAKVGFKPRTKKLRVAGHGETADEKSTTASRVTI